MSLDAPTLLTASLTLLSAPFATGAAAPTGPRRAPIPVDAELLIPFAGDLDGARTEALRRNAPLCLLLAIESVPSNDAFVERTMASKLLAERASDAVLVWGNDGEHGRETFEVGRDAEGEPIRVELCERFRTPTCGDHQRVLDAAWTRFADPQGGLECPQAIVLLPDGTAHATLSELPVTDEKIDEALEEALEKAGPPLSSDDLARIEAAIGAAEEAEREFRTAEIWRQWQVVLDVTEAAYWADRARAAQESARAILQGDFDATVALEEDEPVLAYKTWYARLDEWAGTPFVEAIEDRMKKLERDEETRDEIRTFKRQQEAQAMLDEAIELESQGEQRKAERVVRRLLRKYEDTPAAQRAAKKWPHLVQD